MNWRVNRHRPRHVNPWRWVLGNYWRRLLWALGFHWKKRRKTLDWDLLHRRIRWQQMDAHIPWDYTLRQDPCVYCGFFRPFERMTVEHVLPKSHGGPDHSTNKAGCCASCNRARGAIPLLAFLLSKRQRNLGEWARRIELARRTPRGKSVSQKRYERNLVRSLRYTQAPPLRVTLAELDAARRKPTDMDLRQ